MEEEDLGLDRLDLRLFHRSTATSYTATAAIA
jgi:hypothetical protein